ncbi:unnamed protein product [Musa hybrid cultivar]
MDAHVITAVEVQAKAMCCGANGLSAELDSITSTAVVVAVAASPPSYHNVACSCKHQPTTLASMPSLASSPAS